MLITYCIKFGFTSLKLFKTVIFCFNSNLNLFELIHLDKNMKTKEMKNEKSAASITCVYENSINLHEYSSM